MSASSPVTRPLDLEVLSMGLAIAYTRRCGFDRDPLSDAYFWLFRSDAHSLLEAGDSSGGRGRSCALQFAAVGTHGISTAHNQVPGLKERMSSAPSGRSRIS
jgi:hypothetical protein